MLGRADRGVKHVLSIGSSYRMRCFPAFSAGHVSPALPCPLLQAMSMGIPAIVTGWSGTADFVDDRVGYPLNYSLSVVR